MLYPNVEDRLQSEDSTSTCLVRPSAFSRSCIGDYHLLKKIQIGGQATLFMATKNQEYYAIKVYNCGERSDRDFKNQIQISGRLDWKGVVPIAQTIEKATMHWEQDQQKPCHIIVMPFYENGDLFQWISKKGIFNELQGRYFMKNLLSTFRYLESKYVLHRDIKPENILLGQNYEPLVLDFGLAMDSRQKCTNFVGDIRFASPQVIKHIQCTLKSEIYSMGILFFYILTGQLPYTIAKVSDTNYRLLLQKKYQVFWSKVDKKVNKSLSPSFKEMFISMTLSKPQQRPSIEDLLQFSWFKESDMTSAEYSLSMKKKSSSQLFIN